MNKRGYSRKAERGFTLIEMSVVITVLLLTATFVIPNMVTIRRTRALLDTEAAIQRLPREAHNEAIKSRQGVSLRVEGTALIMERVPNTDSNLNQPTGLNQQANDTAVEVKRVNLGNEISATRAQNGKESTDIASWKWTTYPDGSADYGGIEFTIGSQTKSLVFSRQGGYTWQEGNLPEPTDEEWQAGEIEKRAQ